MSDSVGLYLNEIGQVPLLNAAEERELSQIIERGREAQARLDAGERGRQLRRAVADAAAAKDRFIRANLRLVVSVARRYPLPASMELLDLIQEGNLGLEHAVDKFDWRKGFKFSTYATFWIRQAIQRALENKERTIRVPNQVAQRERKVLRAERDLVTRLGHDPSKAEIAKEAGLPLEEVEDVFELTRVVTSLDRPVGEEGASSLGEFIPDERAGPTEELEVSLRDDTLRSAVAELPEPERKVIQLRYGINGDEPTPIREASRRLEMKQGELRELESRALEHLAQVREVEALRDVA